MKIQTKFNIKAISMHYIGNRSREEGIKFSSVSISVNDSTCTHLQTYFLSSFNLEYINSLFHEADLCMSEVYTYVTKIFEAPKCLHEQSINLAKHLYEKSNHPKIKGGEFYVVYFEDCNIDGKTVDAVGLFKSENKETFLKVYPSGDGFEIESQQGVNINKLDKGALIFNSEKENGYVVAVVDNTNKGVEAHYWINDFLHVRQRKDEYYNTHQVLSMCRNFAAKELDNDKPAKAEFLNRSVQFFKERETFDIGEFANEVIAQPNVIDSFNQYKENYTKDREIEFADSFAISDTAVKKQARAFKSVIKLDKNFHIYIHGGRQLIEQGEDNKGKYYKVYYREEQ